MGQRKGTIEVNVNVGETVGRKNGGQGRGGMGA